MTTKKESDVFEQDKNKLFTKNKDGQLVAILFQKGKTAPIIADENRLLAMKKHSEENGIDPDISSAALEALQKMSAEQTVVRKKEARLAQAFAPVAAKPAPAADTVKLADLKNPAMSRQIASQGRLAKLGVVSR